MPGRQQLSRLVQRQQQASAPRRHRHPLGGVCAPWPAGLPPELPAREERGRGQVSSCAGDRRDGASLLWSLLCPSPLTPHAVRGQSVSPSQDGPFQPGHAELAGATLPPRSAVQGGCRWHAHSPGAPTKATPRPANAADVQKPPKSEQRKGQPGEQKEELARESAGRGNVAHLLAHLVAHPPNSWGAIRCHQSFTH